MIQWMIVSYPRLRDVFIDGLRAGHTGEILAVRQGTQEVHLGSPVDYRPKRRRVTVTGTTVDAPKEISFDPA